MNLHRNYSIVLRGCGERTESLLSEQLSESHVRSAHVHGDPFEVTLRDAYIAGCDIGKDWTVMLDADVIPLFEGVDQLSQSALNLPVDCIGASAQTFDKILGRNRPVGVRIFRTRFLDQLIPRIPTPGASSRPETSAHRDLELAGFTYVKSRCLCGYHGFEQWYSDLIASTYNLSKKANIESEPFPSLWTSKGFRDRDYLAMQLGATLGSLSPGSAVISRAPISDAIGDMMVAFRISEKESLSHLPSIDSLSTNAKEFPSRICKDSEKVAPNIAIRTLRKLLRQGKNDASDNR